MKELLFFVICLAFSGLFITLALQFSVYFLIPSIASFCLSGYFFIKTDKRQKEEVKLG